jgi:hypothetical protein
MSAESGETEAFQLSDVAVQMVSEGLLSASGGGSRHVLSAAHPAVVDGSETTELDGLLCLVNTALLSRVGDYAGPEPPPSAGGGGKPPGPVVKKSGALAARARRALASALAAGDGGDQDGGGGDRELARVLSDYALLVALHGLLGPGDCRALCAFVKEGARQKRRRGANLDRRVRERLTRLVDGS